jgi:uncharacterized protein
VLGLATTLLPCGWLYAFAVVAAGTGQALGGAAVMAAFWAGTVPALALVGVGIAGLGARVRRHVPVLTSLALLCVGLVAVFGRMNVPALALDGASTLSAASALPSEPPCQRKETP